MQLGHRGSNAAEQINKQWGRFYFIAVLRGPFIVGSDGRELLRKHQVPPGKIGPHDRKLLRSPLRFLPDEAAAAAALPCPATTPHPNQTETNPPPPDPQAPAARRHRRGLHPIPGDRRLGIRAGDRASAPPASMGSDAEPAKGLLPYLQRADELQKHEPLVAYYCEHVGRCWRMVPARR